MKPGAWNMSRLAVESIQLTQKQPRSGEIGRTGNVVHIASPHQRIYVGLVRLGVIGSRRKITA